MHVRVCVSDCGTFASVGKSADWTGGTWDGSSCTIAWPLGSAVRMHSCRSASAAAVHSPLVEVATAASASARLRSNVRRSLASDICHS